MTTTAPETTTEAQTPTAAAKMAAVIAHAAEHHVTLTPDEFGPQVTLDGMPAAQWVDATCCMDEPLPSCPGR